MKRVFGTAEAVFNILYLLAGLIIAVVLFYSGSTLAGTMALVLVFGDSFHLIPRIRVIMNGEEEQLRKALGRGKQITSITMTLFYLMLWQLGETLAFHDTQGSWTFVIYLLATIRIILCLLPQNEWQERYPPVSWGIFRNIPFFCMGLIIAVRFFLFRSSLSGLSWMWLAIALSFLFYLPVVLWANRNAKIGMLMLPKTCMYIWMLAMCL